MVAPRSRITRHRSAGPHPASAWELLRRPGLWLELLRQLRALRSRPYREFRSVTAYGDPQRRPPLGDVVAWLRWAGNFRRTCARRR